MNLLNIVLSGLSLLSWSVALQSAANEGTVYVYLCICAKCICLLPSLVFAEVEVGAWFCNLLLMRAGCMCICVYVQSVFVCYLLVYLLRLNSALLERGSAICC